MTDEEVRQLLRGLGNDLQRELQEFFRTTPTAYGTMGKRGDNRSLSTIMANSINALRGPDWRRTGPGQSPLFRHFISEKLRSHVSEWQTNSQAHAFELGPRRALQQNLIGTPRNGVRPRDVRLMSMMDQYVGDGELGITTGKLANPHVSEAINIILGLKGDLHGEHPHTAFRRIFTDPAEQPWTPSAPQTSAFGLDAYGGAMTATKAVSQVYRAMVQEFGGTIYFDIADVYWQDVFLPQPTAQRTRAVSDTVLEAWNILPHFQKGRSRVPYGNGTLVIVNNGVETVPTKELFLSNWVWNQDAQKEWARLDHPLNRPALHQAKAMSPFDTSPAFNEFAIGQEARQLNRALNPFWNNIQEGAFRSPARPQPDELSVMAKRGGQLEEMTVPSAPPFELRDSPRITMEAPSAPPFEYAAGPHAQGGNELKSTTKPRTMRTQEALKTTETASRDMIRLLPELDAIPKGIVSRNVASFAGSAAKAGTKAAEGTEISNLAKVARLAVAL